MNFEMVHTCNMKALEEVEEMVRSWMSLESSEICSYSRPFSVVKSHLVDKPTKMEEYLSPVSGKKEEEIIVSTWEKGK